MTARIDNLAFRRTTFILYEIVNDLGLQKAPWFNQLATLLMIVLVFWFRMFVHYVGQYFILKAMDAPVSSLEIDWYRLHLSYDIWNVTMEMVVIAFGPLSNSVIFLFFGAVCYLSNRYIYCFPVLFCKFIAWYGLLNIMDFIFIVVVDAAFMKEDGDAWKLYSYYEKTEKSGEVGLFVTILIQFGILIFNCYIFYNYIVFIHCDARIKDIYLRISGLGKGYYIPEDNEVSWNYLM